MGMAYGYAQVSTREQHEDRQLIALRQRGVEEKNIYLDKLSGKDFNRPQYRRPIRKLKPGDILVVKSIDLLGRNYNEIIEQWRQITKQKQADIVLQLLSYVAQTEREFIRMRQAEGIAAAKERGEISARKAAHMLQVSHNTFLKWVKEERK